MLKSQVPVVMASYLVLSRSVRDHNSQTDRSDELDEASPAKALGDVLADSVAYYRDAFDLTQPALAQLMSEVLGFAWSASTVAKVEKGTGRGGRRLTAEELMGLSLVLRVPLIELVWRSDGPDSDATGGDIVVGSTSVNNIELRDALVRGDGPLLPALETLTWPAWAVVTGNTGLREQVKEAMSDWEEGMRLLRKEVTDSMRRQERYRRWEELAIRYQHPDLDPEAAVKLYGSRRVQRRTHPTQVKVVES